MPHPDDPRFCRISATEEAVLWAEIEADDRRLAALRAEDDAAAAAQERADAEWEAMEEAERLNIAGQKEMVP